jgi:hypothetical protein
MLKSTCACVAILFVLFVTGIAHAAALPPASTVEGRTIAEWTAEWWQWALSFPEANNPLVDTDGTSAALGDMGSVFFLAGSFNSGPTNRYFAVPSNKYILIPVFNAFFAGEVEGTADEQRAKLEDFILSVTDLHATVNGVSIPNLFSHREISPVFDLTLAADNIFGEPAGTYSPATSDGYWLMLEPLGPGNHVINFGGAATGGGGLSAFSLEITYAPVPEPGSFALAAGAMAALAVRARRLRS